MINPDQIHLKIKSLAELGDIAERERKAGKRIVLCHGTFDLLHIGHIRHLQQARKEGDLLIVTVTSDAFVRRGPGRPVFPAELRAEMLAATQFVDWVAINDNATADIPIRTIKPNAYIKGSDYKDPSEDITGKILDEKAAVEEFGGRIVFTEDIVFSSSSLLNRYGNVHDEEVQSYFEMARKNRTLDKALDLIGKAANLRVAVIGDAILDEYRYVEPMGKSPKENLVPTKFIESEMFAGGVFAAANHVADFCQSVEIVTIVGTRDTFSDVISGALKENVTLTSVVRPNVPTTRKTRFIDSSYGRKLFEVVDMDDSFVSGKVEAEVAEAVAKAVSNADVVIVTDFGHGMITPRIQALFEKAKFLAVNVQTNSANIGFNLVTRYKKADYICIDAPEARLAVTNRSATVEELASVLLPGRIDCGKVVVTHGRYGAVAWQHGSDPVRVPAFTRNVLDTMGAGDAFFAVTAPLVAVGGDMGDVAFVGNAAGALKVNIVGHRKSVEKVDLIKYCQTIQK